MILSVIDVSAVIQYHNTDIVVYPLLPWKQFLATGYSEQKKNLK